MDGDGLPPMPSVRLCVLRSPLQVANAVVLEPEEMQLSWRSRC